MAFPRHTITLQELEGFVPTSLIASGNASDGRTKRLIIENTFTADGLDARFVIWVKDMERSGWDDLESAIEAYNEI